VKIGELWRHRKTHSEVEITGIHWIERLSTDLINYKYLDEHSGFDVDETASFIKQFERVYESR